MLKTIISKAYLNKNYIRYMSEIPYTIIFSRIIKNEEISKNNSKNANTLPPLTPKEVKLL